MNEKAITHRLCEALKMKKGWLFAFLLLFTMNFVASQNLSDLLSQLDESTIFFFIIFIVAFAVLFFALNKVFKKENTAISGIIAVALAFLISWGISKTGFDLEYSLLNIGISSEVLGVVLPLIIVGGIIYLIVALRKNSLLAIGGLFILASFFVYAQFLLISIGVTLLLIRGYLYIREKRNGEKPKGWPG